MTNSVLPAVTASAAPNRPDGHGLKLHPAMVWSRPPVTAHVPSSLMAMGRTSPACPVARMTRSALVSPSSKTLKPYKCPMATRVFWPAFSGKKQ